MPHDVPMPPRMVFTTVPKSIVTRTSFDAIANADGVACSTAANDARRSLERNPVVEEPASGGGDDVHAIVACFQQRGRELDNHWGLTGEVRLTRRHEQIRLQRMSRGRRG